MKKNPLLALIYSAVPGAGQVYVGQGKKGLALLCITGAVAFAFFNSDSALVGLISCVTYLALMIPAGVEAYLLAKTGHSKVDLDSRGYVLFMLLMTGLSALPLLWHSPRFSGRAKLFLSLMTAVLAVLFFFCLIYFWQPLEDFLTL